MSEVTNIFQRMHAVMKDISYVQKGDKQVNGRYRFVGHDAVTAKVREALVAHGIVALTDISGHAQDGNRTEADITVTFVNIDAPEDRVSVRAFGYGIDPQDKGPGKAISYAVKYAYLKAFALETGDDPEKDSIDHKPATTKILPRAIPANVEGQLVYDSYDAATKDMMARHVRCITDFHAAGAPSAMVEYVKKQEFDTETKLALWYLLPSNVRSAYKKADQPSLAEQA